MRQFIAVLCLLLGACASTGRDPGNAGESVTTWRAVAVAATAADLATTLTALRRGTGIETNPALGQQPQRIVAMNAAILGAVWWFSRDLSPEQQARVWKWVVALHLGAALWNGSQLRAR